MNRLLLLAILSQFWLNIAAQTAVSFNDNWSFVRGSDTTKNSWESVSIPHTWNNHDPFDKIPGYYRGVGWYKKEFVIHDNLKKYFLFFEGVNQEAYLYLNGELIGSHKGGYSGFNVELSENLKDGLNRLLIIVDNSHNKDIPPLKGDFNFYGGIYRDIWLHQKENIHFDFGEFGDHGIFIKTPEVSEQTASVEVTSNIRNHSSNLRNVNIEHVLYDKSGARVASYIGAQNLVPGLNTLTLELSKVSMPKLWHPDDPNLYSLRSVISTKQGGNLDVRRNSVGFRWFSFDPDSGFFINDKPLKLIGANRHQDLLGKGNALNDNEHLADVTLIKEMGGNFFRTAHYPQDPSVLTASDQLGLLVSMEIPLDHDITESEEFLENSKMMIKEMILQNYNHPSVIIWAYMNEMLLGRNWERDKKIIKTIGEQAVELEELIRQLDPNRYTMIPNHGDLNLYFKSGLTEIPMVVGWNLYYGWYEADVRGAGKFLDQFHEIHPEKPVLVTEFGAGADPRIRSQNPERFDFSIEWQNKFHQGNLVEFHQRPFLSGAAIWNLADFGSEKRNDAVPKINSKGVFSYDREPKDAFYLYQAWLKKTPLVRIGSRNWNVRHVLAGAKQNLDVYGNGESVELFQNGASLGTQELQNHVASFDIELIEGKNNLYATMNIDGKTYDDFAEIQTVQIAKDSNSLQFGLNLNCGSTFTYQSSSGIIWLPDQPYSQGFFGHVGGENYRPRDRGNGSDHTILGTTDDPVYQTNRIGVNHYVFDVSPGLYEVSLHWSEVDPGGSKRLFNVLINETKVLEHLNLIQECGTNRAFQKKILQDVPGDKLIIEFQAEVGEPTISGIQIKKIK